MIHQSPAWVKSCSGTWESGPHVLTKPGSRVRDPHKLPFHFLKLYLYSTSVQFSGAFLSAETFLLNFHAFQFSFISEGSLRLSRTIPIFIALDMTSLIR